VKSEPSARWRGILRWLPGVLISAVALFVVFRLASWEDLGPALGLFRPIFIVVGVVSTLLFLGLRAIAWRSILGGKVTIGQAFWAINQGYLLNNIFPLRAGELGRAVLLGKASNLRTVHVLSSIIIERAFDLAIAAGLLLATLPLALGMAWARPVATITLLLVFSAMGMLYLMSRNQDKVSNWVEKLGEKWGLVRRFIAPQIRSLLEGLSTLSNLRQFLVSVFWIGLSWLVAVTQYYIFILAIEPQAPYWWGAFTDGVLALGIAIPSAPAAIGTFEAAIVGALSVLGIDETSALAYAITVHFIQFVVTGILGTTGLLRQGRSIGNLFQDIRMRSVDTTIK
jgi:glycosyltransferase 2 family protein